MKNLLFLFAFCAMLAACSSDGRPSPSPWLIGTWVAPAFDGELHETWTREGGSLIVKEGYYIEKGDTLYSEQVRIDSLFGGIYLLAQPRGGNPVIFHLSEGSDGTMTFENHGNRNPYKVVYTRTDDDHFTRVTYGIEQGDSVSNTFRFSREAR